MSPSADAASALSPHQRTLLADVQSQLANGTLSPPQVLLHTTTLQPTTPRSFAQLLTNMSLLHVNRNLNAPHQTAGMAAGLQARAEARAAV